MRLRAKGSRTVVLRAIELFFLAIAVVCFTIFGLMKLDEVRGQAELERQFEARRARTSAPPAPDPQPPAELPGEQPAPAGPANEKPTQTDPPAIANALGRLRSERIGLDVMIAEGVDTATLRRAAGRIPGTARIDELGNVGVAAHRDTFFRPLRHIRQGDELELETLAGDYRYRVEWIKVVEPNNAASLAKTSEPALTLVTCFPFHYVGPAPRRLIVRAKRVGEIDLASNQLSRRPAAIMEE